MDIRVLIRLTCDPGATVAFPPVPSRIGGSVVRAPPPAAGIFVMIRRDGRWSGSRPHRIPSLPLARSNPSGGARRCSNGNCIAKICLIEAHMRSDAHAVLPPIPRGMGGPRAAAGCGLA